MQRPTGGAKGCAKSSDMRPRNSARLELWQSPHIPPLVWVRLRARDKQWRAAVLLAMNDRLYGVRAWVTGTTGHTRRCWPGPRPVIGGIIFINAAGMGLVAVFGVASLLGPSTQLWRGTKGPVQTDRGELAASRTCPTLAAVGPASRRRSFLLRPNGRRIYNQVGRCRDGQHRHARFAVS